MPESPRKHLLSPEPGLLKVEKLEVHSVEIRETGGRARISARVDNEQFWYELPQGRLTETAIGDALLLSTLPVAMFQGRTLSLPADAPVSNTLLVNVAQIQRIVHLWNARFRVVAIDASQREAAEGNGHALFFAGGVDSAYELLRHAQDIDTLICVHGFDFTMSEAETKESEARLGAVAAHYGKKLEIVTTDHSSFLARCGVSRLLGHGMTLGAIGSLMGYENCRIASSYTMYELGPWGSHPLLDPLFSNGGTTFIHGDNATPRFEKTAVIAEDNFLLNNLRVCWESHSENCGECSKCLRTMAALEILNKSGPFPPLKSSRAYRQCAAGTDVCWTTELVSAAEAAGKVDLALQLKQGLRLHDLKLAAKYLIQGVTGKRPGRFFRRDSTPEPEKWNVRPDLG